MIKGCRVILTPLFFIHTMYEEYYFTAADAIGEGAPEALKMTTFCMIVMPCGFTVLGVAYCANPELYNVDIGRDNAKQEAMRKLHELETYRVKCNR